jgi:hypothetical protein
MKVRDWGIDYSIGIFLDDISSIEVKYKSSLILLLANLLSGLQPEKIFGSSTTFWPRVLLWLANGTI